jgi:DNA-binding NarL/FixJ family response regulator
MLTCTRKEAVVTPASVRVIIADDHAMVRQGFAFLLSSDNAIAMIGEARNGLEAVQLCADQRPDVVLMDLDMPIMDGIEATRLIRDLDPAVRVIAFTGLDDERLMADALAAGAVVCLSKQTNLHTLIGAILNQSEANPARILVAKE